MLKETETLSKTWRTGNLQESRGHHQQGTVVSGETITTLWTVLYFLDESLPLLSSEKKCM